MGFEYVMSIVGSGMQLQIMSNGAFKNRLSEDTKSKLKLEFFRVGGASQWSVQLGKEMLLDFFSFVRAIGVAGYKFQGC